jgi:hypothetical protein
MSGVEQTIFVGDPTRKGNCVAACVATLLDIPLEQVPHFVEFGIALGDSDDVHDISAGNNWWSMLLGFMAGKGLWPVHLDSLDHAERGEVVFVAGKSPRGVTHQVLYRDGELWHDPHPSRAGVLTIESIEAWRPLGVFDHAPTNQEENHDG